MPRGARRGGGVTGAVCGLCGRAVDTQRRQSGPIRHSRWRRRRRRELARGPACGSRAAAARGALCAAALRQGRPRRPRVCGGLGKGPTGRRVVAIGEPRPHHPPLFSTPADAHALYLLGAARAPPPPRLASLLAVLAAQGGELVSPGDRRGLHPYVVPLSVDAAGAVTGLLRRPSDAGAKTLAVVRAHGRGAPRLDLVARSVDEFLATVLTEEAAAAPPSAPLAAAAGAAADGLAAPPPATAARASIDAALVKARALTPALAERLVAAHFSRGDDMSALITVDWYSRRDHFPGWGRPYDHAASVLADRSRSEEARDAARVALRMPWWTLQRPFAAVAAAAGLAGDAGSVRAALAAADAGAGGLPPTELRSDAQRTLDAAGAALDDAVAAGEGEGGADWGRAAAAAAALLRDAGLADAADFVGGAASE